MNVVNKIMLDLNCRDERQARQLVAHWTPQLTDVLEEALSELCNSLDDPAKTIVIDRLELNIGNLTADGFNGKLQQLKTGLLKSFYGQFNGNTAASTITQPIGVQQSDPSLPVDIASSMQTRRLGTDRVSSAPLNAKMPDNIHVMDTADREEQAFYYFLIQGNLPWWQKPADFSFDRILQNLISRKPGSFLEVLAATEPARNSLVVRMVRHASSSTLSNLFGVLSLPDADIQVLAKAFFPDLQESILQKSDARPFLSRLLHLVLDFSSGKNTESETLKDFLTTRIKTEGNAANDLPGFSDSSADISSNVQEGGRLDQEIREGMHPNDRPVERSSPPDRGMEAFFETRFQESPRTVEKYATEQAGLILIAGYLPHFFRQLGFLTEQGFASEAAQMRAIHAVHYLVTAHTDPPEYALALEKLLCGFEPSTPVLFETSVDADTLEKEANELLDSLISLWSVLKKTSKEAVRSTFLLRNGILERLSEREWALHVEKGSFDILLNAFPSGLSTSTIIFSWSKFIIYVNWERP